jgi:hypothetical protein
MGLWRYSSTILELGNRQRGVVTFTSLPLYPQGNRHRYPMDRRLGGPQGRSGRCGEEINLFLLPWIEPWYLLGRPARRLFTIPTELSRSHIKWRCGRSHLTSFCVRCVGIIPVTMQRVGADNVGSQAELRCFLFWTSNKSISLIDRYISLPYLRLHPESYVCRMGPYCAQSLSASVWMLRNVEPAFSGAWNRHFQVRRYVICEREKKRQDVPVCADVENTTTNLSQKYFRIIPFLEYH